MKRYGFYWLIWCFAGIVLLAGCNFPTPTPLVISRPTLGPTAVFLTASARLTDQPIPPSGDVETDQPPTPTSGSLPVGTATSDIHLGSTATPTASVTPTPQATPTGELSMINASLTTNCRTGPGVVYPIVGFLRVGEPSEVVGRYQGDTWWVIQHPTRPEQTCWVWGQTTTVSGDISGLPYVQAPPTPVPTRTPTPTTAPAAPEAPSVTETSTFTEEPTSTEAPTSTEIAAPSETPTSPPPTSTGTSVPVDTPTSPPPDTPTSPPPVDTPTSPAPADTSTSPAPAETSTSPAPAETPTSPPAPTDTPMP